MKRIPLTQGKEAIVDDDDYEELSNYKWSVAQPPRSTASFYAVRGEGKNGKVRIRMHRQIMHLTPGKNPQVDHINGNGLDNRKKNLRVCTGSENRYNSKTPSHNTSGHKGVSWSKEHGKWTVRITVKTVQIFIGRFEHLDDAVKSVKKARKAFHREFARDR